MKNFKKSLQYSVSSEKLLPGLLQQLTEKDGEVYNSEGVENEGDEGDKGKKGRKTVSEEMSRSAAYRVAVAASEWTSNSSSISSISKLALNSNRIHRYTVLKDKRDSSLTFQTSKNIEYQEGRTLEAVTRNDLLTLFDYSSHAEIENSQSALATVDLACSTYITAARIRSHLKNALYNFVPSKTEKKELDRMEDLFAMVARPACVVMHPGTKTVVNKHAQEAIQALWGIYNERVQGEKLPLQAFVSARGILSFPSTSLSSTYHSLPFHVLVFNLKLLVLLSHFSYFLSQLFLLIVSPFKPLMNHSLDFAEISSIISLLN